jgi:20S proteasome alpha/beta subunit
VLPAVCWLQSVILQRLHWYATLQQQPLCCRVQIETYNGSAIVAMAGDKCVAIGSDLRFGVQMQTMATDHQKLSQIHDRLFVGLSGLATDQVSMRGMQ